MTNRHLRRILKDLGCVEVREVGSHLRVECGTCRTTVPVHAGEDLKPVPYAPLNEIWNLV
jgi:predicted RNA binding protein YcfA (HicA-like mRNA interferase family)